MNQSRTKPAARRISVDLLGAAALFVIGAVFLGGAGEGMRDWLFPRSLSYLLLAAGAVLAVRASVGKAQKEFFTFGRPGNQGVDVAVFMTAMVIYLLLITSLGFWWSSALMIFVLAIYLSTDRNVRAVLQSLAVTVFACALGYYIFQRLFFVNLPRGPWFPF